MLDDRAKLLLKTLVERYIAEGQPVGSRTLSRAPGLDLSPATIRNVMSDLESLGLIASPHTSAGRIPTARGYRLFVDTMGKMRADLVGMEESQSGEPVYVFNSTPMAGAEVTHLFKLSKAGEWRLVSAAVVVANKVPSLRTVEPSVVFDCKRSDMG